MPRFISAVGIARLAVNFLSPSSGIVNVFLGMFGVEPIYFLTKPKYFRTIYVLQGIWAGAGFDLPLMAAGTGNRFDAAGLPDHTVPDVVCNYLLPFPIR